MELSNISESFNQSKDFLFEKYDGVKEYFYQGTEVVKNSLSELTHLSFDSINKAKNQGVEVISETTNSAVNGISKITAHTKDFFTETTQKITDLATTQISQAVNIFTEVGEKIMEIRENLNLQIPEVIQRYLSPDVLEWVYSHTLITLITGLFLIFLLLGFFRQVFSNSGKSFKKNIDQTGLGKNLTSIDSTNKIINNRQRLMQILTRLEEIKNEQDLLLREASEIIKCQSKFK
ncbi:hypothetical protein [Okeania sp.]|uniref:hypothetical protein n=1 Tax=Okeania sp. TaxID=3100323 RepID=UPI002B4B46EA|nr:hypothetical protein [Okeania sp.]MEB3339287.1 hypothetical protein [Okeania sp.]